MGVGAGGEQRDVIMAGWDVRMRGGSVHGGGGCCLFEDIEAKALVLLSLSSCNDRPQRIGTRAAVALSDIPHTFLKSF